MVSGSSSLASSVSTDAAYDVDAQSDAASPSALYDDEGFDAESASSEAPSPPRNAQLEEDPTVAEREPPRESIDASRDGTGDCVSIGSQDYDDDAFEADGVDSIQLAPAPLFRSECSDNADELVSASASGSELRLASASASSSSYGDDRFEAESVGIGSPHHPRETTTVPAAQDSRVPRVTLDPVEQEADHESRSCLSATSTHHLVGTWCSDKIAALAAKRTVPAAPAPSTPFLPRGALEALMAQLQRFKSAPDSSTCQTKRSYSSSSPALSQDFIHTMLARANAARLLLTSSAHMVPLEPMFAVPVRRERPDPLRTFCATKCASLEGPLATARVEREWARLFTSDPHAAAQMSVHTLEFITHLVTAQRRVVAASSSRVSHQLSSTLGLERTVEATEQCLRESQHLQKRAATVLRPNASKQRDSRSKQ